MLDSTLTLRDLPLFHRLTRTKCAATTSATPTPNFTATGTTIF